MKRLMIVGFAAALAVAAGAVLTAGSSQHTPVTLCHNVEHNPHTIVVDDSSVDLQGHQAHLDSGFDTLGACPTETTSPPTTESPTTTEAPVVSPTVLDRPVQPASPPAASSPADSPPATAVQGANVTLTG